MRETEGEEGEKEERRKTERLTGYKEDKEDFGSKN